MHKLAALCFTGTLSEFTSIDFVRTLPRKVARTGGTNRQWAFQSP